MRYSKSYVLEFRYNIVWWVLYCDTLCIESRHECIVTPLVNPYKYTGLLTQLTQKTEVQTQNSKDGYVLVFKVYKKHSHWRPLSFHIAGNTEAPLENCTQMEANGPLVPDDLIFLGSQPDQRGSGWTTGRYFHRD